MSEPPQHEDEVLGNLPRHRPSVRSPRRAEAREAAARASASSAGDSTGASGSGRSAAGTATSPEDSGPAPEHDQGGGPLEDLARAGASAALDAATIGLRLAGKGASGIRRVLGGR